MSPVSKAPPLSAVAVCAVASLFLTVTLAPARTVSVAGVEGAPVAGGRGRRRRVVFLAGAFGPGGAGGCGGRDFEVVVADRLPAAGFRGGFRGARPGCRPPPFPPPPATAAAAEDDR